ncbi:hypothetical protein F4861DRAFT_522296 [Xylaria intraflava]|nr:hypothetical protein F4861DRAFT_522296 [Xylaria intraflava]
MAASRYGCVFCGELIHDSETSVPWGNQFRGLYKERAGIVLTGVGLYENTDEDGFIAPADSKARWDDEGYTRSMKDCFGTRQLEYNGRHGFAFHDACWYLFTKAFPNATAPASLERLYQVLSSLPFTGGIRINWGHDFGRRIGAANEFFFPWHRYFFPWHENYMGRNALMFDETTIRHPCDSAEANQILAEAPESPPEIVAKAPSVRTIRKDPLTVLPPELCAAIATHLPTSDALNARLASRVFLPVFYDQQFWASRFRPTSDRAWFFEALERRQTIDWRWLYRRTHVTCLGSVFRKRLRIWNLFAAVIDILNLRWHDLKTPTSESTQNDIPLITGVIGDLWEEPDRPYPFQSGCRLLQRRSITVPNDLSQFSVSYIQTPNASFISGIKFTTITGKVVQLGYWATTEYSIDVTSIWGFILAVGPRGIQAMKCLTGRNTTSCWLGCPENVPKTRRFAMFDTPLDSLEVGFDGFKIVSLDTTTPARRILRKVALQSLALWYPDLPSLTLSLNENDYVPRDHFLDNYKPLFWTHFGGPGGKYLKHLLKVSVTLGDGLSLVRIDFTYNIDVPVEYRSLGRYPPSVHSRVMDFAIDGPGGEVINAIEVDMPTLLISLTDDTTSSHTDLPLIPACKLFTNRARSCKVFVEYYSVGRSIISRVLDVKPGTTITGFYASQNDRGGLTSLGVISEVISQDPDE